MATLIAVYNSDGCVGRCDAKCYEAVTSGCDCVCGGMNHGAGKDKALENTQVHAEEMVKQYAGEKGLKDFKSFINDSVNQAGLFE